MHDRFDRLVPGTLGKLHLLLDTLVVMVALFWACGGTTTVFETELVAVACVASLAWFFAAAISRLYSPCTARSLIDCLLLRGLGTIAVVLSAMTTHAVFTHPANSIEVVVLGSIVFALGSLNALFLGKDLASRAGEDPEHIVIVGTGPMGVATYKRLTDSVDNPRQVAAVLRFPGEPTFLRGTDVRVIGESDDIDAVLSDCAVNEVYIAGRVLSQGMHMQEVVRSCENIGIPFALPLHSIHLERASLLRKPDSTDDGYLHYLTTRSKPMQYAVKRLFDIVASAAGIGLLLPLFVGVAVMIKLTSRGPIFFRQIRVGLHGAHFDVLKFRSMVVDAERLKTTLQDLNEQNGPVFKMRNDPRVTRVGRFIRKYSIDELPQLINVLRGDMTIVGPRPAPPEEVAKYKAWQRRRLSVRPGLTCLWQVGGRNQIGFEEWMRLDLQYIDTWTLGLDSRLILRTFPVVLAGRGAS
ncbi:MAG: hypothetical protein A2289_15715 [Deltaproteobacteria bacterium RIFOXYA12_FULL_58_15]|nr:MAG: hypothetical protein A2289_15715 [Deltaproteobacteria bacterium RIFOXYA12_FULL_58_15]OGR14878.1 MAG: hypothetical protein A2341_18560 [Deltaproteobacteria bacterium RIFOXYB12_FULL_58_9]